MAQEIREDHRPTRSEAKTQQTWSLFLDDLGIRLPIPEEKRTRVAVVVLDALEQRLQGGEANDLYDQLPVRLKELLGARPAEERAGVPAGGVAFVQAVGDALSVGFDEAESCIRAVFATVRSCISEGEAKDVESQLPPDLWSLWALSQ